MLSAPSLSGGASTWCSPRHSPPARIIASEIAGYSDVVTDGVDGVLVPPADPQRLAEELQRAWLEPERIRQMGANARESSKRYAWESVASRVNEVYERAIDVPEPGTKAVAVKRRLRFTPNDALTASPPRRLRSLDPAPVTAATRRRGYLRKGALVLASVLGIGMTVLAANRSASTTSATRSCAPTSPGS